MKFQLKSSNMCCLDLFSARREAKLKNCENVYKEAADEMDM